jgi:hypothetical protein
MMLLVITVLVIVAHRYRKAAGLRPNFMYSSVMGPYASIRLPGGFRVGHKL